MGNEDFDDSGSDGDGQPKVKDAKPEACNIKIAKYILNQTIQPVPVLFSVLTQPDRLSRASLLCCLNGTKSFFIVRIS
jgi:hypothetical protein